MRRIPSDPVQSSRRAGSPQTNVQTLLSLLKPQNTHTAHVLHQSGWLNFHAYWIWGHVVNWRCNLFIHLSSLSEAPLRYLTAACIKFYTKKLPKRQSKFYKLFILKDFGSVCLPPLFLGRIEIMIVVDPLRGIPNLARLQFFKNGPGCAFDRLLGHETERLVQFGKRDAVVAGIEVGIIP